jgi:hypothetical protein
MSLTSYRAAPSRDRVLSGVLRIVLERLNLDPAEGVS